MKEKFIKFLKSHRLYSAFIRNLNNPDANGWCYNNSPHRCIGRKSDINHYLGNHDYINWIGAGFMWGDTPEDMQWCDLDREWEDLCNE